MEDLVEATVLNCPVANQLGVGGAQVDLLIGQLEEGRVLVWTDAVGSELVEGSLLLLGSGGQVGTGLQRGAKRTEVSLQQETHGI